MTANTSKFLQMHVLRNIFLAVLMCLYTENPISRFRVTSASRSLSKRRQARFDTHVNGTQHAR